MATNEREQIYKNVENAVTVYVNSAQVAQSPFDLRLWLGTIEEAQPDKIVTRVHTIVYMSPQHAKVLSQLFVKHIQKYESIHGNISIPTATVTSDEPEEKA